MPQIKIVDTGVVYINPNPGYQYTFASHSDAVQISSQELYGSFQCGQALYATDSVILGTRSTDGGNTWTTEGRIHDPAGDDRPYSYHGPMVTRYEDGSMTILAHRWDRSDPDKPLFNEKTRGLLPGQTLLFRSTDNGATWVGPEIVHTSDNQVLTPSCKILVLADGRWMMSMDQWHAYDEPGPYKPRTVGLFSSDKGKTWGHAVTFGVSNTPGVGHWHGRIHRMRDNRLFTLFWSAQMESDGALPHHYCIGSADGSEWSTPVATNIPGQTNCPVDLGEGRMAVIYTVRETDPPGFFAAVSEDGGNTWDLDNQILVWDATGRDKIGIHALDRYPRSHDTISYGAPTAMVLENGDVYCTFWCTEAAVPHIRFARLQIT